MLRESLRLECVDWNDGLGRDGLNEAQDVLGKNMTGGMDCFDGSFVADNARFVAFQSSLAW